MPSHYINQCWGIVIWTRTHVSEILIEIHTSSFKNMHLKISSAKWRPFGLGLSVLITASGMPSNISASKNPWNVLHVWIWKFKCDVEIQLSNNIMVRGTVIELCVPWLLKHSHSSYYVVLVAVWSVPSWYFRFLSIYSSNRCKYVFSSKSIHLLSPALGLLHLRF